jgi:hypothetical protein
MRVWNFACTTSLALAASCLITAPAAAAVVTLGAVADNTVLFDVDNERSNGADTGIFVGMTALQRERRGVLRFDFSSIPAGSVITSVSLTLRVTRTSAATEPVNIHRALSAWGEGTSDGSGQGGQGAAPTTGDCTWTYAQWPNVAWNTLGGDYTSSISASQQVTGQGFYNWNASGLKSDVQGWLDGTFANHGWFLLGNETAPITVKRFAARNYPTASFRPSLTIEYTPVPAPGAAALAFFVGVLGCTRKR